ncbi:ATP-binding protein [Desulfococcus multivorans]|uniref:Uncharacterized protein n=1 Tax=Desulfococcus multivorans DSM 2059 TaxID=1121405 RepID=S7T9Q4_DESML|nr:ATP-binding protein [Desulfococcus multivorans]AOY57305.1 uncharacterized protein Dmul_05300 [Desulfococcus multivorans]AQU99754.1 ATP-binding protein [Desulfococcus multivorans]EPR33255.1 hypothetical protein dsmv_3511 [Desulfococcus multivorans DSM 2059]SKA21698.1 hypothetical protein SAMN02745446_03322 [Desulfococcus multivorans DSM 2059]
MSIEIEMNELLDRFRSSADGLFAVYGRYSESFEGGIYICAIAKPTKRMRATLSADRELLLVASSFTDQQQRTIKFIKREIEKAEGRYEKTIAIVIHKDPSGNQKLRNWGRDLGIAILPIYGNTAPSESKDLEKYLCYELYSHDPFDVTGPVSDDSNFFGRRDEAIDLARKLQKGQIRSCLGIRKVGKTSIINRVIHEIKRSYECNCLMVDCSRDDVWELNAARLLNSINGSVEAMIQGYLGYISIMPIIDSIDIKLARDKLQKSILSCKNPVILIFDEIDYITPGSPTNPEWSTEFNILWRNLRSIYQECDRHRSTMSILIGGVSTHWFCVETINNIENAALSFIPEEYLSPMPERATIAMLKRLGKVAGLHFEESALSAIALATGNMPYWARKCGSYIHRQILTNDRPCKVDLNRVRPLIDSFVMEEGSAIAEVALCHLFRVNPDLKNAAAKCSKGLSDSVSEPLKRRLRRYGVLDHKGDLSGQMISHTFCSLQLEECKIMRDTSEEHQKLNLGLNEWAEEIASLSKRRNIIESRLRNIALNFLRFDSLNSGRQHEVKDRIIKVLSKTQQPEVQHLSAEEAMGKLTWKNLSELIAREWPLFERLFGDKSEFKKNADIINDRFDAHAKPADQADIALYRRSLSFIEERISKIY